MDDGRVVVGLIKNETAIEISMVDSTGKLVKIDPNSIEERRDAGRSLMPSNIGDVMTSEEFGDLLQFIRRG